MNSDTATNKPSKKRFIWVTVAGTMLCLSLCGASAFFLFKANVLSIAPSATPTLSGGVVTLRVKAVTLMYNGKFNEALPLWDAIIQQQPDTHSAYYQRAICYYKLSGEEHNRQQHDLYVRKALADMDQAISMQPRNGDYYAFRHDVWIAVLETEEYRVNRQAIARIAHEDIQAAITLGVTSAYPYIDRAYAMDLTTLEQCDESLAETERILQSTSVDDSSITGLYRMQAEANACLGNFEEAVRAIDASLHNPYDMHAKTYLKAVSVYQSGKPEEALSILNSSLEEQPTFVGYRYYLRALIYYEMGEPDLAEADLETGFFNTWEQMGLRAYVSGKMALNAGKREEGIELLQQAEATLDVVHSLIRTRIQKELAELGAEPLSLTPSITFSATPNPINHP